MMIQWMSGMLRLRNVAPAVLGAFLAACGGGGSGGAVPPVVPPVVPAPDVPAGLAAGQITNASIALSWTASSDAGGPGVAGYHVFRDGNTGTPIATVTTTQFTDQGLSAGTTYHYQVAAFDGSTPPLSSAASAAISVTTAAVVSVSAADAARLLNQATFGATSADIDHVRSVGIQKYLQEQVALTPTFYPNYPSPPAEVATTDCKRESPVTTAVGICYRDRLTNFPVQSQFMANAVAAPDQLRQRVAYALSQILVISNANFILQKAHRMALYQNILVKDALGNYRQLLEDVTLSPGMGQYLDMVNNDKTDPVRGTTPNENYAREILQLFSIGVDKLNADGSVRVDARGAPLPAYDQDVIEGFAYLFTGWTFAPIRGAASKWTNPRNYDAPMVAFAGHHETGQKQLLDGYLVPAGQTPAMDLKDALDNIFNHPNVGPFIGRRLIQRLVTSNPSPAYIARVSAVFADNGKGVRGDLAAVVTAILTDPEARGDVPAGSDFGRLREPILAVSNAIRTLGGKTDGAGLVGPLGAMAQSPFGPPTVFNFYPPDSRVPGSTLYGPEFFIYDAATVLAYTNFIDTLINRGGYAADPTITGSTGTSLPLASFAGNADAGAIVDLLSQKIMQGRLGNPARNVIVNAVNAVPATDPTTRVRTAAYLLLTSAQFRVER